LKELSIGYVEPDNLCLLLASHGRVSHSDALWTTGRIVKLRLLHTPLGLKSSKSSSLE